VASKNDVIAELFAAPPEGFVAERTKLARSLRDEGRAEEAREVASLRKPTLPAYLANRLAHERPRDVAALLAAAKKLAGAHGAGDAEKLRRAQHDVGERVRELVALAPQLSGRAVSESVGQRLAETLRAAATDRDAAALLRRGVLQEEVETTGFEALAGLNLAPSRKPGKSSREKPSTTRRGSSRTDARVGELRKELTAAREDLRSAETAARAADREASRARRRVSEVEARLERLTQAR
jgi:hypothetical protein